MRIQTLGDTVKSGYYPDYDETVHIYNEQPNEEPYTTNEIKSHLDLSLLDVTSNIEPQYNLAIDDTVNIGMPTVTQRVNQSGSLLKYLGIGLALYLLLKKK